MAEVTSQTVRKRGRRARPSGVEGGRPRRFGRLIVFARWPVFLLWIGLAVGAVVALPAPQPDPGAGLQAFVPPDSPAVRAEIESVRRFGSPLLARTVVVQRDPDGLSATAQTSAVLRAIAANLGELPELEGIAGALPVTNELALFPSSREDGTTMLTYLFFDPDVPFDEHLSLATRYANLADHVDDHVVGITGAVPGRLAQAEAILDRQTLIELVTVLVIVVIVGLHFRAVGAPLLTVAAAGLAYLVASRSVGWALDRLDIVLPDELEPLTVVLVLGIVTDYSIFFLDHARTRMREGHSALDAVRHSAGELVGIVTTAGLVVALGAAALVVAGLETYRTLGPGLGLSVLVALLVAITFVPAGIAVFGRLLFWPSAEIRARDTAAMPRRARWQRRIAYAMTNRAVAVTVSIVGIAVLVALASNVRAMNLGFSLTGALPEGTPARRAAIAAGQGFAPGIISPTLVTLDAAGGTTFDVERLSELEDAIASRDGIAAVIGPREAAELATLVADAGESVGDAGVPGSEDLTAQAATPPSDILGVVLSEDGRSARMLVVLDSEPFGAPAIETVERLGGDLPALLERLRFGSDVTAAVAGDTALAADAIDQTMLDLRAIALVIAMMLLVLLAVFLRSIVAAVFLLAVSALGFAAALGISTWVFGDVLGTVTTSFFVPFAAAVLLVALGSDYNIFLAGRIWNEARRAPLREAIATAAPDASRTIAVAGITLAASFAVLALVPIRPMQQLAFVMGTGILLDAFLVRALLVPALVAAFGQASAWPGRFRRTG